MRPRAPGGYTAPVTDLWDERYEPPDPDEVLGDLYEVAAEVFDLHRGGSDLAWAAWAWGALTDAGLAAARTEYERGELVLRLLALNAFHREFLARAGAVGEPGDWPVDPERVLGDHPRLHPVLLGVIAERRGLDLADGTGAGDVDFDVAVPATALDLLVRSEYRHVLAAVTGVAGRAALFAATWVSGRDGVRYPLPDDEVRAIAALPQGRAAREWLASGARLG